MRRNGFTPCPDPKTFTPSHRQADEDCNRKASPKNRHIVDMIAKVIDISLGMPPDHTTRPTADKVVGMLEYRGFLK